jgi:hypothetical protein
MKGARWVAAATLITVLAAALPAAADEASTHFQRGVELYSEADYRAALNEFRRAYELEPRFQVLYNIAMTDYQLLDYAGALQAFEKYLRDGGGEVPAAKRSEVERELGKLRARVAKLEIISNVSGAQVTIDDAPIGTTPLAGPVLVSAGRRRVTVSASGRTPASTMVDVVGGDTRKISVELQAAPDSGRASAGTPPPTIPVEPPPRSIPWVGWIITGAFAVGTGVTGVLALQASSDLKTKLGTLGVSQQDIDSAHSKTTSLGIASDALLGATAVAAGVSLYFTLRTPPADTARAPLPTTIAVAPAGRGARIEVTF